MSGICGHFVRADGCADRVLLGAMTAVLAKFGSDAQRIWCEGPIGFGHSLLQTTTDAHGPQPRCHDDGLWITADARIDAQPMLRNALRETSGVDLGAADDTDLILHAYRAWGERCVEHLRGDFAFAIWDAARRTLFAARDHFGIKPFFHARIGTQFVFASALDGVRLHPGVSDRLDDLAVADFLLFDGCQDAEATTFADVRRLPPAHAMSVSATGVRTWRYWTLPRDLPVRHRPRRECIEGFRAVLREAVADRLRVRTVGFELTGGLDSSTIAATVRELLAREDGPAELHGCTVVYDRLIPDQERHYSGLVAKALGIRHHVVAADDYALFERYDELLDTMPEPYLDPTGARYRELYAALPAEVRVVLTGWDGDALLSEPPAGYFRHLWHRREFLRWGRAVAGYCFHQLGRGPPVWWRWLRGKLRTTSSATGEFPPWIHPELVERWNLRERQVQVFDRAKPPPVARPYGLRALGLIGGPAGFFAGYESACTGRPLEFRHPLLDLRVIEYCLSLPAYPWCYKKRVLREAFRDVLPEPVRRRPKAPLAGFPYLELLRNPASRWLDRFIAGPRLSRYLVRAKIPPLHAATDPDATWQNLRPLGLDFWLKRQDEMRQRGDTS